MGPVVPAVPPTVAEQPAYESPLSARSEINRPAEPLPSESVTSGSGDYLIPPPSGPASGSGPARQEPEQRGTAWIAVIAADREYFTAMMARSGPEAESLYFPAYSPRSDCP